MKYMIICLLLILAAGDSFSQTRISGKVSDGETGFPLAYAQIRASEARLGTITNEEGYFSLSLGRVESDTLVISHIGFESYVIPVSRIIHPDNFTIELIPRVVELDEVVIHPVEPEDLLRKAIEAIPENYGHKPMNAQGFYRELAKEQNRYITFNEGVLDIYKEANGAKKSSGNRIKLLKGHSVLKESEFGNIVVNFSGDGPDEMLSVAVTGEIVGQHFLNPRQFKFYEYRIEGITTYNGRNVYMIGFDQREKLKRKLYQGNIFLDVKSLAFVSIDYRLSNRGKKFRLGKAMGVSGQAALVLMRTLGYDLLYQKENGRLDYVCHQGRWYLNYHRQNVGMHVNLPKKQNPPGGVHMEVLRELAITRMNYETANRFADHEILKPGTPLPDQMGEFDEAFWENYNFLKPTDSLKKIVEEMKQEEIGVNQ